MSACDSDRSVSPLGIVLVTSCSNSPRSSAPEEPRLDVEPRRHTKVLMPCVDPIDETDDLLEGYRSALDVVALPETTTHQRGPL
jgi:hypothetical protein